MQRKRKFSPKKLKFVGVECREKSENKFSLEKKSREICEILSPQLTPKTFFCPQLFLFYKLCSQSFPKAYTFMSLILIYYRLEILGMIVFF